MDLLTSEASSPRAESASLFSFDYSMISVRGELTQQTREETLPPQVEGGGAYVWLNRTVRVGHRWLLNYCVGLFRLV